MLEELEQKQVLPWQLKFNGRQIHSMEISTLALPMAKWCLLRGPRVAQKGNDLFYQKNLKPKFISSWFPRKESWVVVAIFALHSMAAIVPQNSLTSSLNIRKYHLNLSRGMLINALSIQLDALQMCPLHILPREISIHSIAMMTKQHSMIKLMHLFSPKRLKIFWLQSDIKILSCTRKKFCSWILPQAKFILMVQQWWSSFSCRLNPTPS